jgi:3-oxoacyl-[acyl-carrier-protein] synthase-3
MADVNYLEMDGRAVFRWAVGILTESIREVLAGASLELTDVDLFIPHQANLRIIRAAAEALGIPTEKFFTNLDRYGNTSAGSVPLALDEAVRSDHARKGDLVVLSGFGSGLAWGSMAFRL